MALQTLQNARGKKTSGVLSKSGCGSINFQILKMSCFLLCCPSNSPLCWCTKRPLCPHPAPLLDQRVASSCWTQPKGWVLRAEIIWVVLSLWIKVKLASGVNEEFDGTLCIELSVWRIILLRYCIWHSYCLRIPCHICRSEKNALFSSEFGCNWHPTMHHNNPSSKKKPGQQVARPGISRTSWWCAVHLLPISGRYSTSKTS